MLRLAAARYRCTSCGDCCRGWDVPLQPGEADAFRALAAPLVPAERLARAIKRATHAGVAVEALVGAGGQCVALAEDQRCRIHGAHGGDAKPRACRIFPFTFVATPTEVRVGLSFACPAVIDAEGPPLDEQRAEIEHLFAGAVDGTRYLLRLAEPIPLGGAQVLSWPEAARLLDELERAFAGEPSAVGPGAVADHRVDNDGAHRRVDHDGADRRADSDSDGADGRVESGGLARRLCRAGALAALVQAKLEAGARFDGALTAALAERDALTDEALAEPPSVDRLSRALFRTLLRSTEPNPPGALARIGGALASLVSGGAVRLRGRGAPSSVKADASDPTPRGGQAAGSAKTDTHDSAPGGATAAGSADTGAGDSEPGRLPAAGSAKTDAQAAMSVITDVGESASRGELAASSVKADTPSGRAAREVRWADAERVAPGLGADGEALLGRWIAGALSSLTFFGAAAFELPIAGGLDLLVLSSAVAAFLARAYAADAGRARVALDDVRAALRQLDAGLSHRSSMPAGFGRALAATASLDLLREQLSAPRGAST
jgi:Fe-S-cluster containining protein